MQISTGGARSKQLFLFMSLVGIALALLCLVATPAWANESAESADIEEGAQLLETRTELPASGELVDGVTYYVPQSGLALTGKIIVPTGAAVIIEPQVESGNEAITQSGSNFFVVYGSLSIKNVVINASNSVATPAINLVEDGAEFYSDGMKLTQAGSGTADGSATSFLGIIVGDITGQNGVKKPNNTVLSLKNSNVLMSGKDGVANYVRAVGHWDSSTGSSVVIDNTRIEAAGSDTNNATYGQGVFVRPSYSSSVTVDVVNSSVVGFYYPLFCYSNGGSSGVGAAKNFNISDSTFTGYAGMFFNFTGVTGDGGRSNLVVNATDSNVTGRNTYPYAPSNSFSAIVVQNVHYGTFNFSNCEITALSTQGNDQLICNTSTYQSWGTANTEFNFIGECILNCAGTQSAFGVKSDTIAVHLDSEVEVLPKGNKVFETDSAACVVRSDGTVDTYTDFGDAVLDSLEGDTIKLLANVGYSGDLTLPAGLTDRIIDLNGFALDLSTHALNVQTGASIAIIDSTVTDDPTKAGTFTASSVNNAGEIVIYGGVFKTAGDPPILDVSSFCAEGYEQDMDTGAVGIAIYNLSYELNGGSANPANPSTYTFETDDFTLYNPTKTDSVFLGWTGTGLTGLETEVKIKRGTTGDRSYEAHWKSYLDFINKDPIVPALDEEVKKPGVSVSDAAAQKLKELGSKLYLSILRGEAVTGVSEDDAEAIEKLFLASEDGVSVQMIVTATPKNFGDVQSEADLITGTLDSEAGEALEQCFDITVALRVIDEETKEQVNALLSECDDPLAFILHLDPALLEGFNVRVLYVHGDVPAAKEAVLGSVDTETGNINVSSTEFSVYGVALTPQGTPTPTPTPTPMPTPTSDPTAKPLPRTGDFSGLLMVVGLAGSGSLLILCWRRVRSS